MAKVNNPRKTWQYSKDFKVKAVKLSLQPGIQVKQVAEGLDIHPFMLSRWRKDYRDGKLTSDGKKRVVVDKEKKSEPLLDQLEKHNTRLTEENRQLKATRRLKKVERLEQENARLKKENSLLKKWQRYLSEQHQKDLDS